LDCFGKIQYEPEQAIDKHSKILIASNLELFLNYCTRFYDRQFITRDNSNKGMLEKFEALLNGYFSSGKTTNYWLAFSCLLCRCIAFVGQVLWRCNKKETGKSAQEYIRLKVIDMAKEKVFDLDKSKSEVAYDLGFKYRQHFTRLFKQKVGVSPNECRNLN
jgi:AraC family transcriptional regulator, transcriptional activator of pobA